MPETTEKVVVKESSSAWGMGLAGLLTGGLALVGEAMGVVGPRGNAAFRGGAAEFRDAERITRLEAETAASRREGELLARLAEKDASIERQRAEDAMRYQEKQIKQLQGLFTLTPQLATSATLI